jgi:hypothetical protein
LIHIAMLAETNVLTVPNAVLTVIGMIAVCATFCWGNAAKPNHQF